MLKRRVLLALLVLASLSVGSFGQDKDKDKDKDKKEEKKTDGKPVLLKWKFDKDKTFYQEMNTTTKQTMTVMGSQVVQTQDQTFFFSWTPLKQDGDNWVLKQKIEGVKMNIDIGGSKISYDSSVPQGAANPLSEFFKALVGAEFTLTIDKDMRVTKIEGRDKFLDALVKANPQMKPLLEQILSEQALKEMADPTFAAIPNREVKPGESWKRDIKLSMGPIGTYENTFTYTFEGPDGKLQKISVKADLRYVPPTENAPTAGLPFKIKSADLKSPESKGTIWFDAEKGRVDKTEMNVTLKGKLSIEIGGQTTAVDLDQTQTTKTSTSDTPLNKK